MEEPSRLYRGPTSHIIERCFETLCRVAASWTLAWRRFARIVPAVCAVEELPDIGDPIIPNTPTLCRDRKAILLEPSRSTGSCPVSLVFARPDRTRPPCSTTASSLNAPASWSPWRVARSAHHQRQPRHVVSRMLSRLPAPRQEKRSRYYHVCRRPLLFSEDDTFLSMSLARSQVAAV